MSLDINGSITIESDSHTVEYEPGQMQGLSTLYLRLKDGDKNIPIHLKDIDTVIEMLKRGQKAIWGLENFVDTGKRIKPSPAKEQDSEKE